MDPIITELDRDFESLGKQSVRDCLRSKTIPCPEVSQYLSQNYVSSEDLRFAYSSILTKFLSPLKDAIKSSESTLHFISKAGTVIRFIHLILERETSKENSKASATPEDSGATNKLLVELLRSLTSITCSILEDQPLSHNGNDETEYLTDPIEQVPKSAAIACFVFASLLKLNHYVDTKPFLLSPLWKGLCDMAALLQRMPSELTNEAFYILANHLKTGGKQLLQGGTLFLDHVIARTPPTALSPASFKIMTFLLARLSNLFKLNLPSDAITSSSMAELVFIVCHLRGLCPTLVGYWKEHKLSETPTQVRDLFENLLQITSKANKCIDTLLTGSLKTASNIVALSEMFQQVEHPITYGDHAHKLSKRSFSFGNLILQSTFIDLAVSQIYQLDREHCEPLLKTIRSLLFNALPTTQHILSEKDSSESFKLSRMIAAIATAFVTIEYCLPPTSSGNSVGRDRYHRLLISWLHQSSQNVSNLTIQVLQNSLALFLSIDYGSERVHDFLGVLCSLLFDRRTSTRLACAIESLLAFTLELCDDPLSSRIKTMLTSKGGEFVESLSKRSSSSSKKRKRIEKARLIDAHDLPILRLFTTVNDLSFPRSDLVRANVIDSEFATQIAGRSVDDLWIRDNIKRLLSLEHSEKESSAVTLCFLLAVCKLRSSARELRRVDLMADFVNFTTALWQNPENGDTIEYLRHDSLQTIAQLIKSLGRKEEIPSSILAIFRRNLASSRIAKVSTLSCLVKIAPLCPDEIRRQLPKAVPSDVQKLLQSRLKGSLADWNHAHVLKMLQSESLIESTESDTNESLFPSLSLWVIRDKSLILSMPTKDGREAIVIFPPGKQSEEDIKYMLGGEDSKISVMHNAYIKDNNVMLRLREKT